MATRNVVNLDALVPRADFTEDLTPTAPPDIRALDIRQLEAGFLAHSLRKPDFQRETAAWTPEKIVDLIRTFLDAELIPSVILWQAGRHVFVLDGAHRVSAVLAWIHNDYGDEIKSRNHLSGLIPDDQQRIAQRTRDLVKRTIGTYADYMVAEKSGTADPVINRRLANITTKGIPCQWIATVDFTVAEKSFFKINQAATPLDPVEERILRSRGSPHALAARGIMHGGTGTRYWKNFTQDITAEIEALSKQLYNDLFEPPIGDLPVKSIDLPIAGRGYNALPFVFDLVNLANGRVIPDSTQKKALKEKLPDDANGQQTTEFLRNVSERLRWITGEHAPSLGLHPAIYTYSRSGAFQPTLFLAMSEFVEELKRTNQLKKFQSVRQRFEAFLFANKGLVSEISHKFGSGSRSINKIVAYYVRVMREIATKDESVVLGDLAEDNEFLFLVPLIRRKDDQTSGQGKGFTRETKTATFLTSAVDGGVRCVLCGALVHKKSMNFDHGVRIRQSGTNALSNSGVTHFWCNSDKK